MAKKFYWLKLKEDFFRSKEIKKLRRIAGGDTYTIIYLKMQLLSLKDEGKLYFEGVEDTFVEEMALEIDEEVENVQIAISYLMRQNLLEEVSENEYVMPETVASLGSESDSARRVRALRERNRIQKALQCNGDVTPCNTEKEKEKEIELEKEIDLDINNTVVKDDNAPKEEEDKIPYKQIVEYLNLRTGKKFKHSTRSTKDNIKARWNEGFNLEDFKKVIDVKASQWSNNPSMKQYLRPLTLFSNKFESYLNEEVKTNGKVSVGQYGGNQASREDAWTEHEAERAREYVERIGGKELDCDF